MTSTACAEQMAVATIVVYDIYKPYINKNATSKQMVTLTRVMVIVYAIISGVVAVILLKLEVSLGWVYLFMGIVIGSAVFPVSTSVRQLPRFCACGARVVSCPSPCTLHVPSNNCCGGTCATAMRTLVST